MPCHGSDIVRAGLGVLRRGYGLAWRDIAALDEYAGIPAGTLCSIAKGGEVPRKYRRRLGVSKETPRLRLVAQVTETEYNAVKVAAEREGVTMAEYIRRIISP